MRNRHTDPGLYPLGDANDSDSDIDFEPTPPPKSIAAFELKVDTEGHKYSDNAYEPGFYANPPFAAYAVGYPWAFASDTLIGEMCFLAMRRMKVWANNNKELYNSLTAEQSYYLLGKEFRECGTMIDKPEIRCQSVECFVRVDARIPGREWLRMDKEHIRDNYKDFKE